MKTLIFCSLLLIVHSLVPNCAFESNNVCRTCYYGFNLNQGRCDNCSSGFVMVNGVCIDQASYQQQTSIQSQQIVLNTTPEIFISQPQTKSQVTANTISTSNATPQNTQQYQTQTLFVGPTVIYPQQTKQYQTQTITVAPTVNYPQQTTQIVNQSQNTNIVSGTGVPIQTLSTTSTVPSSNAMIFDISNTATISLLQMFGLSSQIPSNCQQFTSNFKCLQCLTGYSVSPMGNCVMQSVSTTASVATTKYSTQFSTSQSATSSTSSTSSSGSSSSSASTSSSQTLGASTSSDPNCKTGANGCCYECYYSYYYNSQSGLCVRVDSLCQTWNYLGSCLSCFPGYLLAGTQCVVNSTVNPANSSTVTVNNGPSLSSSETASSSSSLSSSSSSSSGSSSSSVSNPGSSSGAQASTSNSTSSTITGKVSVLGFDQNCKIQSSNGSCLVCYDSYYYDTINTKRCVSVNPLCKTWDFSGNCLSCFQGYNLISNSPLAICVIQSIYLVSSLVGPNDLPSNQDPNCNSYKNQVCIKCANRMYLDSTTKRCLPIDPNCMNWTDLGACLVCYNGYYVYNQTQCLLLSSQVIVPQPNSQINTDPNCITQDSNGLCTLCIARFVLDPVKNLCIKVNDQCRTWSKTTALCTSCYGGYMLTSNGQCVIPF